MAIYNDIATVIGNGGYDLADLLHRIDVLYARGLLTDDEYQQLLDAAADGVDMDAQLPGVEERDKIFRGYANSAKSAKKLARMRPGRSRA